MEQQKKPKGRPKKPESERLVLRSIRMNASQWAKLDAVGIEAFRAMVDAWKTSTYNQ